MSDIVQKRLNINKDIDGELAEIKKILSSKESDQVKLDSVRAILSDLAKEINKARAESIYEDRTGFLGPKFGEDFLAKEIEVCRRYRKNFTVGLLDIDFLKYINDHFGHVSGTKAIMAVADSIKEGLRSADVVSRYGGDEFLIIFTDTDMDSSQKAVDRIMEILARKSEQSEFRIATSYGLTEFNCKEEITALELIEKADKELYKAKQNRGNPNL